MQGFYKRAEALFALTQRFLGFLALSDIADRKDYVCHFALPCQVWYGINQGPKDVLGFTTPPAHDLASHGPFRGNRTRPGKFGVRHFLPILSDGDVLELSAAFAQNLVFVNSKYFEYGPVGEERLVIRA